VVLGRYAEPSGSLLQRLRVDVGGQPAVRNDLAVGPRWPASQGPAGVGDARALGTAVLVNVAPDEDALAGSAGVRAAALRLSGDAWLVSVLAPSAEAVTTALARATATATATATRSPAAVS
jgi:urease accessory protein